MDKRIKYYMGLDTETCNGIVTKDDKLDLSQSLVYDIGWAICDKRGNVYKTRSVMTSAYYAEKIPNYWNEIQSGQRKLVSIWTAWKAFKDDLKEYGIKNVFAHNAGFDVRALNNTISLLRFGIR